MLVRPSLLQSGDTRGGQPTRVRAEQRRECVLKVAAGDALEIEDRDQNLEALRAARVGRQDRGCEPDAALTSPGAVANARRAHGNRAKAGQDRALGSMAMAHQPLAAILGLLVGMAAEEGCDLSLDGLRQQGSRALAQNFGERVGELCWLDQLDDIILGHGVSLLRWRSGGWNTPTIRRLNPSRRHQIPRIPPLLCWLLRDLAAAPGAAGAQTICSQNRPAPGKDGCQSLHDVAPVNRT